MLALLLAACAGPAPIPADTDTDTGPADADGDGVYTPDDCDDADAAVFPGAPEDPPGDGVDADCDGPDGVPYVGCAPILVPDVFPTIEDALSAGETSLCLGAGTFTPGALPEGARGPTAFKGQGRDQTFVTNPAASYRVGVLAGLTATGVVSGGGSLSGTDVSFVDADVSGVDSFLCDRCALVRSPVHVDVVERIAGIVLNDTWVTGAEDAITVVTSGCSDPSTCSGDFTDIRINNATFTDNARSFVMDLAGNYQVYLVVQNAVFLDDATILAVDIGGPGAEPSLYPSGSDTVVYGTDGDGFPDGYSFRAREQDPQLDRAFSPPRPMEGSPLVDAAGDGSTLTDFWGVARDTPDRGAVER